MMIDGSNTTFEWQRHSGDICVLPVGSFEQHSHHLPLDTDIIQAEYFGRMVADDLGAALLPTLPLGTCMEHSGFRGSISLRPETLMQIVRDVAEAVEVQGFKIMVVVNGHGGNFALGPVIRDINRRDRGLKILLVAPWEHSDPNLATDGHARSLDIHAGEMETSVMLALRPDLVRLYEGDTITPEGEPVLRQPDLNTFGAGHFSRDGVIGYPSLATADKGHAIIESIRDNMLPHVRARIARLRQQPRYAGPGGLAVRELATGDIPVALHLTRLAGWNQVESDWRIFLDASPSGCFAAVHNGRVIGTVTTIRYGSEVGWIGMLLVDPELRRLGIGRMLMERALSHLLDCSTVGLDATALGKELYLELGFREEYSLQRQTHHGLPPAAVALDAEAIPGTVIPVPDELLASILERDRAAFGADRSLVLRAIFGATPRAAWCLVRNGNVAGYCSGRRGDGFFHIGPVVAAGFDRASQLIRTALREHTGQPVVVDVPDSQIELLDWLRTFGFARQRSFVRMVRGISRRDLPEQQFASVGPEFG